MIRAPYWKQKATERAECVRGRLLSVAAVLSRTSDETKVSKEYADTTGVDVAKVIVVDIHLLKKRLWCVQ